VAALAAALVFPWPSREAAAFVAASALIHMVYFLLVGRLYRNADLSVACPIMRGLAPLIAFATLGEAPGPVAVLGIVILVFGVMLMGASGLAHGRIDAATLAVALANSVVIAVYSVIDEQGGRISGPSALFAFAYNSWADALTAVAYVPIVLLLRGRSVPFAFVRDGRRGLAGGLCRLRRRDLGDDPGADRRGRRLARNLGRVRRADRRRPAGRAVPNAARRRCAGHLNRRCHVEARMKPEGGPTRCSDSPAPRQPSPAARV
jgi:hypothetical protein